MAVPVIHTITRWEKNGTNTYGKSVYKAPVEITAFWIDDEKETQAPNGMRFMSMARILSATKILNTGDRAQFETLANSDIKESYIVRRSKFVENGAQTSQLYTSVMGGASNGGQR